MTDREERLKELNTNKLIDVVKNYRQYGYDDNLRACAISILEERGITKERLEFTGNFANKTYDDAVEQYKAFCRNSIIALILLVIVILLSASKGEISVFISSILYLIFFIKSYLNHNQFYKVIGQDYGTGSIVIYLLLGPPFYLFLFFFYRNQMKEKMKAIQ
jgi:hypothetical protein